MVPKAKKAKTKRQRKPVRKRRHDAIDTAWSQAMADIVASAIAREHVSGEDVARRRRAITLMLRRQLPRAQFYLRLCSHPRGETRCRCRAYALLRIEAYDLGRERGIPCDALFQHGVRFFDNYMNQRN
jgi:hypothetical protein